MVIIFQVDGMKIIKECGNIIERRACFNLWAKIMAALNLLSWGVILLILIVTERAKPQFESFFDRFYKLKIRTSWDPEFVDYLFWLVIAGTIASSLGLILRGWRARRREDTSCCGLFLMGAISVLGLGGVIFFLL